MSANGMMNSVNVEKAKGASAKYVSAFAASEDFERHLALHCAIYLPFVVSVKLWLGCQRNRDSRFL
jgi:hypothetical protein